MRIIFLTVMIALSISVEAQSKYSYTAGIEAELLKGNNGTSHAFLFNNGLSFRNTMASIGAGTDNYVLRSIPVYFTTRQMFGHSRMQPFVNVSAGINFQNLTDEQKQPYSWHRDADFRNGFFGKTAAGVSLKIHNRFQFFVSAGYSYKTTKIIYDYNSVSPGVPPNRNTDIYRMNRWNFSIGFWF